MNTGVKIFQVLSIIFGILLLPLSAFYGPNIFISFCLFVIAWTLRTRRISKTIARIITIITLLAILIYVIIPKQTQHCGVLYDGPVCGPSHYCVGIPLTDPLYQGVCIGFSS